MGSNFENRPGKPRVSAVLLARNEEENIGYCLQTVGWCDEIIVVDMESADRTAEIAREYTDRVYGHPLVAAFDIAKKFAVGKATGDWIMLIDADEMVPVGLSRALLEIAAGGEADIVEVPYKLYIMGDLVRYSGWGGTFHPCFFRKEKMTFTGALHNFMHGAPGAVVARLPPSDDNCILHFNYIDSAHFVEKMNRYTSVEAQQLFDGGAAFSYYKLCRAMAAEFYGRFFRHKGYKDGVRGISLCLMMAFYRALSYIKLWEKYEFRDSPVSDRYKKLKESVLAGWSK